MVACTGWAQIENLVTSLHVIYIAWLVKFVQQYYNFRIQTEFQTLIEWF